VIELCSTELAPDPGVLESPGGFTWFYVDLVDERGCGATVIWSWGLPFLPGYAHAARIGRPERPIDRPSVNVAVYGPDGERFYLLTEIPPDACSWAADDRSWRLGDCTFTWTDAPGAGGATRTLEADLDLALPTGGRATGRLRLSGQLRRDPQDFSGGAVPGSAGSHVWSPMVAASRGELELNTPDGALRVNGRAYHDRNSATLPLDQLGIRSWWWGRLAFPGRDLIVYRLVPSAPGNPPRDLVVEVTEDGSCRVCEDSGLIFERPRHNVWGLRWPRGASFQDPDGRDVHIQVRTLLDNGPFYQRYLLQGRCDGAESYGIGENLVPHRVDGDLLRPLVRMRVHRANGPNSMWLPLFSGPSQGRWGRLIGRPGKIRV